MDVSTDSLSPGSEEGNGVLNENLLSSKQLFAHRKPTEKCLPKKGVKDYCPDGSWLDGRRRELFWEERRALLAEQRVEKLGSLVRGQWNPDKDLVELEKELGKFWAYMGFVNQQRKWLYPEEALFLMETNVLEVWYRGVPVSIQQAYSCFLGRAITLDEYQVYAHLRRLGFVVIRHLGQYGATRYERQIRLDQHTRKTKRKRKLEGKGCENDGVEDNKSLLPKVTRKDSTNPSSVNPHTATNKETEFLTTPANSTAHETKKLCTDEKMMDSEEPLSTWNLPKTNSRITPCFVDFSDIELPSVCGKNKVVWKSPSPNLLPTNVVYPSDRHVSISQFPINLAKEKKSMLHLEDSENEVNLEFSFPHFMLKSAYKGIKAKNWHEYKLAKQLKDQKLNCPENSPVAHLWTREITPLIRPQDASCTANIQQRLRVIKEFDVQAVKSTTQVDSSLKVAFDVYYPDSKFKKSTPGIPHCRIHVQKQSDPPPTLSQITEVATRLNDDVSLLCAVVDSASALMCYQCNSSLDYNCQEMFDHDSGNNPLTASYCDLYEAKYCIKTTGIWGGIVATHRFCSAKDMGDQCQYIMYPDHDRMYQACVYTCWHDDCNSSPGLSHLSWPLLLFTALTLYIIR
ncbi:tRNA-splicing endonuclease subunit Sen54-like [Liolophura sinensis]|uniref:tRNA-splicing endonuclease subunit Sen54-like n=1 Tax=Liolophura sinensis TaxID=3198878 RepID=UPI003158BC58